MPVEGSRRGDVRMDTGLTLTLLAVAPILAGLVLLYRYGDQPAGDMEHSVGLRRTLGRFAGLALACAGVAMLVSSLAAAELFRVF
jgi:hypothetical protein